MHLHRSNVVLYLVNAALLLTHEIDSAFWREWELFGIPGGIQVFLVLNFGLILAVLFGLRQVVRGVPSGLWFAGVLAASGLFAFAIHTALIQAGRPGFTLPVSQVLLWATLFVSAAQALVVVSAWRATRGRP